MLNTPFPAKHQRSFRRIFNNSLCVHRRNTNIHNTVTIGFKYFDCKDVKEIAIWARCYCNGVFEVRTAWDGEVLAEIPVISSNIWEEYTAPVELNGVHALYFTYKGTGNLQFKGFALR